MEFYRHAGKPLYYEHDRKVKFPEPIKTSMLVHSKSLQNIKYNFNTSIESSKIVIESVKNFYDPNRSPFCLQKKKGSRMTFRSHIFLFLSGMGHVLRRFGRRYCDARPGSRLRNGFRNAA